MRWFLVVVLCLGLVGCINMRPLVEICESGRSSCSEQ